MNKVRKCLEKGWTIVEDDEDDGGYVSYWLVTPLGTLFMSFPSKQRALVYWGECKQYLQNMCADNGQKLAEECGLTWDSLSDFEKKAWTRMSGKQEKI